MSRSVDDKIERVARAICSADGVDPDKTCVGMGIRMPLGQKYPAWVARMEHAEAVLNVLENNEREL